MPRPTPAQYKRPGGSTAAWNQPVSALTGGIDPNSAAYVKTLVEFSANQVSCDVPADASRVNFNIVNGSSGYSYPVYYAGPGGDDNDAYTINGTSGNSNMNGHTVPFRNDGTWLAATGSDAQMIIVDPAHGWEFDFYHVTNIDHANKIITCDRCNLVPAGVAFASNPYANPANIYIKNQGNVSFRGPGIPYLDLLITPQEVANGVIPHCTTMTVPNPRISLFRNPGTKIETGSWMCADGNYLKVIEGSRFYFTGTAADIESWITNTVSHISGITAGEINLARCIATCWKDYGCIVSDHAGASNIQIEDIHSAQADWQALGITQRTAGGKTYPQDLMDGLFSKSNLACLAVSPTYPPNVDTTNPVISNITASSILSTSANITWATNVAADSVVEFVPVTAGSGYTGMASDPNMVTNHFVQIIGLTPSTLYHYRVWSRDGSNELKVSGDNQFTTAAQVVSNPSDLPNGHVITHANAPSAIADDVSAMPAVFIVSNAKMPNVIAGDVSSPPKGTITTHGLTPVSVSSDISVIDAGAIVTHGLAPVPFDNVEDVSLIPTGTIDTVGLGMVGPVDDTSDMPVISIVTAAASPLRSGVDDFTVLPLATVVTLERAPHPDLTTPADSSTALPLGHVITHGLGMASIKSGHGRKRRCRG